ncbi:MAG: hypothetical protein KF745_11010 [Phycisphaeraceae bacterium]|nr:hypothetical protein [Phycisphaeraceae bacterium]
MARDLMAEIMQTRYSEPCATPLFGPEVGESSRSAWDDVDDYNGYVEKQLTDRAGGSLAAGAGWQRAVAVARVSPTDPMGSALSTDLGLKRITVTATSPRGGAVTLVGFRSPQGAFDFVPDPGATVTTGVTITLQLGTDAAPVTSATGTLNLPFQ